MNKIKTYLMAILICATAFTFLPSCKKGADDPVISTKTRKDRFTNTWTLTKYEKNGVVQDISGSTYTYSVFNNGTLTQTIEGTVFGFPARTVNDGTWAFLNDDEDVKITITSNATIHNIQRLVTKELWLKKTDGADIHMYYFDGL